MSDEPSGLTAAQFAQAAAGSAGGLTTAEVLAGAEHMAAALRVAARNPLDGALDEYSPYRTGVCPACGEPVEFAKVDATMPGGPPTTVAGRWICRTVGCKYGEPA